MGRFTLVVLRGIIALSLLGSLVVQVVLVPLLWVDLEDAPLVPRILFSTIVVLGVLAMQVFAVCVWRLLTFVRRGSVFSERSFRYVDIVIGAIAAASLLTFATAVLLAPGDVAPGIVGLVCGAALVLAGMTLLVVVLRRLLAQAIAREDETRALRAELRGVI